MFQLLRGSCLECHHLLAPRWTIKLILVQLECLDNGLLTTAIDLENFVKPGSDEDESVAAEETEIKLREIMQDALQGMSII